MIAPSEGGEKARADEQADIIDAMTKQRAVDQVLIDHLEAEGVIDPAKIADLEDALVTCRHVGVAIGVLMEREQITQEQSFDLLRVTSVHTHRKLRHIADRFMLTGELPGR